MSAVRLFCNSCSTETVHEIKAELGYADDKDYDYEANSSHFDCGSIDYQLVQCMGAEQSKVLRTGWLRINMLIMEMMSLSIQQK